MIEPKYKVGQNVWVIFGSIQYKYKECPACVDWF